MLAGFALLEIWFMDTEASAHATRPMPNFTTSPPVMPSRISSTAARSWSVLGRKRTVPAATAFRCPC